MKFSELLTTRKGKAGEDVARAYMEKMGRAVYGRDQDSPRPIDFIVVNPVDGRVTLVDVKTYPRLYSAERTGIDAEDWRKYQLLAERSGNLVYLLFVDVFERTIYGAFLNDLSDDLSDGRKVYFPLSLLRPLHRLTPAEASNLSPVQCETCYLLVDPYFSGRVV
jgi:Holliday junction resolvase-like predicted endonuclease